MKKYFPILSIVLIPFVVYLFNHLQPLDDLYNDWVINIPIVIVIGILILIILKNNFSLIMSPITGFLYSMVAFVFLFEVDTKSLFGAFIYSLFFAIISFASTLFSLVVYKKVLKK